MTSLKSKSSYLILLLILGIIIYKLCIITSYASRYIDDDQALMWYGTQLANDFLFKEPHFLGQAYGSMFESVVAVPFYKIGINLPYALPLATNVIWLLPFVLLSVFLFKKKLIASLFILIIPIICSWQYDILTSISRSFISGFIFSFIGFILSTDKKITKIKSLLIPLLFAIAFINTETSITITLVSIMYIMLYRRTVFLKHYIYLTISCLLSIWLIFYCNQKFYLIHPDYLLHGGLTHVTFSLKAFLQNVENIFNIFYAFFPNLLLLLILAGYASLLREWKLLIIAFCIILGIITFFFLPKTLDFRNELLFSQLRMFLFIPYLTAQLLFISFYEHNCLKEIKLKINYLVCLMGGGNIMQ